VSQINQSAVRNGLLKVLPPADFGRLAGSLTPVTLSLKQSPLEADEPIKAAYFIETGMVSYLHYLEGGEALEVGLIGLDGLFCVFRRKRPGVSVQTAHRFGDFAHPPHRAGGRAAS